MHRGAFLAMTLALLPACTIVQVSGANPATSIHFGILKLEPALGARSISYRIRGVGLVPVHNGATIGFAREDAVLVFSASSPEEQAVTRARESTPTATSGRIRPITRALMRGPRRE